MSREQSKRQAASLLRPEGWVLLDATVLEDAAHQSLLHQRRWLTLSLMNPFLSQRRGTTPQAAGKAKQMPPTWVGVWEGQVADTSFLQQTETHSEKASITAARYLKPGRRKKGKKKKGSYLFLC